LGNVTLMREDSRRVWIAPPVAYTAVLTLLGSVALLATAIPARRAMRVDPAITLRED
jgi:ABC-type lipoprotein release transport system permease subunit